MARAEESSNCFALIFRSAARGPTLSVVIGLHIDPELNLKDPSTASVILFGGSMFGKG